MARGMLIFVNPILIMPFCLSGVVSTTWSVGIGKFRFRACNQVLQVTSQIFYYLHSSQIICQLQNLVGNSMKQKMAPCGNKPGSLSEQGPSIPCMIINSLNTESKHRQVSPTSSPHMTQSAKPAASFLDQKCSFHPQHNFQWVLCDPSELSFTLLFPWQTQ